MDVFSRYLWLPPLEKKSSRCIARNQQKIFEEHGPPDRLQRDQGKLIIRTFRKSVQEYKIKGINSKWALPPSTVTMEGRKVTPMFP